MKRQLAVWLLLAWLLAACQAGLPPAVAALAREQAAAYLAQVSPGASIASQRWAEPVDLAVAPDGRADRARLAGELPAGAGALCYRVVVAAAATDGDDLTFTLYGLAAQDEAEGWRPLGRPGLRRSDACR
jgi:hypothetical protein